MKSFKELSRTQKIITIVAGLLAVVFFIMDDSENEYYFQGTNDYTSAEANNPGNNGSGGETDNYPTGTSAASFSNESGKVVVYDQGFQMPRGTYNIPNGWNLKHDIATNPSTGITAKYNLDINGPNGELLRALGTHKCGSMMGMSFEQGWKQVTMQGLQGKIDQISLGNLQPDPATQARTEKHEVFQRLMRQGNRIQCLQAPVSGIRNGKKYQGMIQLTHMMPASNAQMFSTFSASYAISPAENWSQTLQTKMKIDDSYVVNPSFEQRLAQVNQQAIQRNTAESNQMMANSQAAHQQRMANNQAAFNASQQRINDMNQMNDANNARWMENFRNSGSYNPSNNGYDGHDAYIDQIHERSTFNDPYSGQEVNMDGQYDYNYTNGLGDYYRTNDPNFDPNSLQGDYQQIEPLNPNF